jgi:hypothetical protein
MAGKKGRSGRPRLSIEHHLAHGTFRRDRHGPRPPRGAVAIAIFPAPPDADTTPEQLLEGLAAAGTAFARATHSEYRNWSTPDLLLLRQAAQLVDLEQRSRESGDVKAWMSAHRPLLATLLVVGFWAATGAGLAITKPLRATSPSQTPSSIAS